MENVSGLTNNTHKHFYKHIIQSLENTGYSNYAKVLNTKDYGVPQNRERIFIVSIRNDINKGYNFPEPFDNGLRLKDFLELEVDEKYYIPDEKCEKLLNELNKGKGITDTDEVSGLYLHDSKDFSKDLENGASRTLKANKHDSAVYFPKEYQCGYALNSRDFRNVGWKDEMATLQARDYKDPKVVCVPCITPDRVDKRQNGRRFKEDGEDMFTLTGQDVHGVMVGERFFRQAHETLQENDCESGDTINAFNKSVDKSGVYPEITTRPEGFKTAILPVVSDCKRLGNIYGENYGTGFAGNVWDSNGICPTLQTAQGGGRQPHVPTRNRIRKLTPKECWRLQGIKDEDFEKAEQVNSNSQLYKQAGNGVSVNVVMEIIKELVNKGYMRGGE
jgi:DNA (cytosine-5)-methyltransferase 1